MFFTIDDDFESIIKHSLKSNFVKVKKIPTGWTNFVFYATKDSKTYVFRFPRNLFFAKTLIKEKKFNKLLARKLPFKVPKLTLMFHEGRPFTIHRYQEGKSLTECATSLSTKQVAKLCKDIAKLNKAIQKIKIKKEELPLLSDFLEGLSKVGDEPYDLKKHNILKQLESESLVVQHADLNPGNIILNEKNKMFAVIDFAFLSYTSKYVDLARIIGRLPKNFYQPMIEAYEKTFKTKVNKKYIDALIHLWEYVEKKYIAYMAKNHKDVELPTLK